MSKASKAKSRSNLPLTRDTDQALHYAGPFFVVQSKTVTRPVNIPFEGQKPLKSNTNYCEIMYYFTTEGRSCLAQPLTNHWLLVFIFAKPRSQRRTTTTRTAAQGNIRWASHIVLPPHVWLSLRGRLPCWHSQQTLWLPRIIHP